MTEAAQARIANIALVKPMKARALEDRFLSMAQKGSIRSKVTEEEVKRLLEVLSKADESKSTKVTVSRDMCYVALSMSLRAGAKSRECPPLGLFA